MANPSTNPQGTSNLGAATNVNDPIRQHMPRAKRIIACCDGTTNDGINSESSLTNVARLSRCISHEDTTT